MEATHRGLEVGELGPAQVSGPESFARSPMTADRLVHIPGVSGYRLPSQGSPWLELRLGDGTWLRIRPVDEELAYYHLEPLGSEAARNAIRVSFLPRWSAFKYVALLAGAALERTIDHAETRLDLQQAPEDETGPYVPVERIDNRPIARQRLDRYVKRVGKGASAEVSLSAGFR